MEELLNIVSSFGVGLRPIKDPFFDDAYKACKIFERKGITNEDEEDLCHEMFNDFPCNACPATFTNLVDFELHYHDAHRYVCAQCKLWRPTERLLDIHVQENHDSYFRAQAERQPMYQCFVSDCEVKFSNPIERREHCIHIHEFPKHYRFDEYYQHKPKGPKNQGELKSDMKMEVIETHPKKKEPKLFLGKNIKQKTFSKAIINNSLAVKKETLDENDKQFKKLPSVTMFVPRQVQQKSYVKALTKHEPLKKISGDFNNMMELAESLPKT